DAGRACARPAARVGKPLQRTPARCFTPTPESDPARHVSLGRRQLRQLRQVHRIVASGIVNRIVPSSAFALGVARVVVHGTFLVSVLITSFLALGRLPVTILRPMGVMKFLPWSFYDRLLTPAGMIVLEIAMILSLVLSTAGLFTVVSTKTSFLLVLFYQGLVRSFGHFNHDEMLAVYCLAVLAFTPCGDEFSLDQRRRKKQRILPAFAYAYPILLMQLLMAWVYFSSALIKLRAGGLSYLNPDNLPSLAIYHSLDNLHD